MPEMTTLPHPTAATTAYVAGLRQLADFLETHAADLPAVAYLDRVNVWHPTAAAHDGAIIAAAEDAGHPVTVTTSGDLDTVTVRFGELVARGLVSHGRRAGQDGPR